MSEILTINCKLDEEQMDVLLGNIRDLLGRIDALEQRIEKVERKLNHKGGDE